MLCPRCHLPLTAGLPHTQLCPQCEGVWVEKGSLSALLELPLATLSESPIGASLTADHDDLSLAPMIACPMCQEPMTRYVYCADSGITLDRCIRHGIWFDDGELSKAMDYVQLGRPHA